MCLEKLGEDLLISREKLVPTEPEADQAYVEQVKHHLGLDNWWLSTLLQGEKMLASLLDETVPPIILLEVVNIYNSILKSTKLLGINLAWP